MRIITLPVLCPLIAAIVVVVLVALPRHLRQRRQARRDLLMGRKCKCGYLLVGLELPRCPECGRMIGFDKTPEELGLSVPEMEAHIQRKKAERAANGGGGQSA